MPYPIQRCVGYVCLCRFQAMNYKLYIRKLLIENLPEKIAPYLRLTATKQLKGT